VWGANLTTRVYGSRETAPGSPRRVLEPVLRDQGEIVTLIEDLAPDLRVALAQPADLSVLLRDELLVQGRDLDIEIELGEVEVRGESLDDVAITIPVDREGGRFVVPTDLIEVEQPGELSLGCRRW
jgi:hypothetical protein